MESLFEQVQDGSIDRQYGETERELDLGAGALEGARLYRFIEED
ncbi:MAG: hypothetical protein ABEJ91_00660 [Candidatus Nanohaloarchaea archaeon]